ncbi:LysM peptidoglycan-binding domain-containing protein [Ralstonia pseudosolanacearum]
MVSSGPVNLPANGTGVASGTIVSSGTGPLHASYIEALAGSNTNQPGSTATTTRYDAAGRVLSQHVVNEVDGTRSYDVSYEKTVVTGTHTVQVQTGTTPVLDESGSPTYDESGNAITTPVYGTQTITDTAQVSTYDAAGNALGYRVTQNGTTTDYTFSQALYEGYQEGGVSAVSSAGSSGSTGEQYDANGFLVGLTDSTQGANNRSFVNDANGHILRKNQQGNLLNQLVVNGQVMGTYGVGTDPNSPTNSEGNSNYTTQGNFDLGYQPVTNSYPAAATGQYPIKSGDTLESIAQSAYGDSQLWYQIAQANGLSGNADLRVGQIINIPTRVGGTHNTANTFAPYDPSKVEGSTSPNLPAPSSDDGGGCGVIGQVIMIVVAIVVTIYTAGAAAGAFGAVATGTAGTTAGAVAGAAASTVGGTFTTGLAAMAGGYGAAGFGAAVVGGAVGSIASQAVGNAIGAQHGFSWGQVALSGVAAGLSAGVGAAASGTALAATQGGAGIAAGIGRAAIGSVVTQGVSVAVGLQDHFSWQQVAASAVAGGVGAAIGEVAGSALAGSGLDAGVQKFVARTVAGIAAGTTAAVMRGGRVQIAQIVADAFGNALGESLAAASSSQSAMPQWAQSMLNGPNDPLYGTSLGIDSSYATRQSIFDAPSSSGDWSWAPSDASAGSPVGSAPVATLGLDANGAFSYTPGPQYAPIMTLAANDVTEPGQQRVVSDAGGGGDTVYVQLPTTVATPKGSYTVPPEVAGYGTVYGGGVEQHYADVTSLSGESWFADPIERNYAQASGQMFTGGVGSGPSSWDALTQQKDATVAVTGTYNRFDDIAQAFRASPGSASDWLIGVAHAMQYERPVTAQPVQMNPGAVALNGALESPFAGMAVGLTYALGGSHTDAMYASQLGNSLDGLAAARAGYQLPKASQMGGLASSRRGAPAPVGQTYSGNPLALDFVGPPRPLSTRQIDMLTSYPGAHSLQRHGGSVTDGQLMIRALTGVAPDNSVKLTKSGQPILPPMSSAFHSDQLLGYADQYVRSNGALANAIQNHPGEAFVTVTPADVGDMGLNLGRGYVRLGGSRLQPDLQGAPQLIDNLRSVQGTYYFNATTGQWETVTLFPAR